MSTRYFFASLTRISSLAETAFAVERIPREPWATGDYVVGEVNAHHRGLSSIELGNGRMIEVTDGDLIVGALGQRCATLEAVGDWQAIGEDLQMEALTSAGLFGKVTSKSAFLPALLSLTYRGHVLIAGKKVGMRDFVPQLPERPFTLPVVLIVGTSMSAGKTSSARTIVRLLKEAGLKVIGAKLTGAGRYRDILSVRDAGADWIFDFVDVGLPSTVCPPDEYRQALRQLLARMLEVNADVVVAEAGASPLEPYNGATAIAEIERNVRCTVLCASDPYGVVGVATAFKKQPDLVAGAAANTAAGIQLVAKLSGMKALDLLDKQSLPKLRAILKETLGF
ncbi:MAG: DUF1611 domain-containing protein [Deltaproteobacteria bacterium]|nr:DUF1611 domain-containing protein [Deltaproteobacteria bacterium]